ncbi:MAG: sugar transferase [Nitrospira sp.]|nr:sugar transferase [Nitrospira sp.]
MKRFFDLVVASGALLLLSPLLLVLAMLVKLGDGGAVLYRGPRVGLGGRSFRMCKFRTMLERADARSLDACRRSTRPHRPLVATVRLDELPQVVQCMHWRYEPGGPPTGGATVC